MNIIEYAKKYGNKTIKEKSINEVDYLILTNLAYINFDDIVASSSEKISMENAGKLFFKKYSKDCQKNNIIAIRVAIEILETIYLLPRYKDFLLYNYEYVKNQEEQFSAIFIDIDKKLTLVSFEGTDELISGWKEDAEISYKFPTNSQKDAIKYLNRKISVYSMRAYIIAGHSKGGNLALISSMYANNFIKLKIKKILNFDGPGLRDEQINSFRYKMIASKYTLIIPNYSVVGLFFRHPNNPRIVYSSKRGIMAHNVYYWSVLSDKFDETKLSNYSIGVDKICQKWLENYDDNERKEFVEDIFQIFKRANINSLLDLKKQSLKKIIILFNESKSLSLESKKVLRSLMQIAWDYVRGYAQESIKNPSKFAK